MLTKMYSVYDRKALFFLGLFPAKSDGEAVRMVLDAKNDPNTTFNRHPDDFSLYSIATFDDSTGKVIPAEHNICLLATLANNEVNPDDNTQSV